MTIKQQGGILGSTDMYFAIYNGGANLFAYTEGGVTIGNASWSNGVTSINFIYEAA